jgi:hypothetical protein
MARLPLNIEPSGFRPGHYVVHTDHGPWIARKGGAGGWEAAPGIHTDLRLFNLARVKARTLDDLSAAILKAQKV